MADNGQDRYIVQLLQTYIGANATDGNDVTRRLLEPPSGGERLYAIATPFIFVIGLVGNLVSLRVFSGSPRLRRLSASLYLSAISVSDCLVLLTYVLFDWINKGLPVWPGQYRVRLVDTQGVCQTFLFMSYTCRFVSMWLIVLFNIERYIAVCRPFRRRVVCTKTFAHRAIALVVLIAMIASIHKPLLSGVYDVKLPHHAITEKSPHQPEEDDSITGIDFALFDEVTPRQHDFASHMKLADAAGSSPEVGQTIDGDGAGQQMCRHNPDYEHLNFVMELIYGATLSVVPFVPIAVFNIAILRALVTRDAAMQALSHSATNEKRVRRELTILVLVISASLVCLSVPYLIVWCIQFIQSRNPEDPEVAHWIRDKLFAAKTIFFANYAINFVLYSLAGANYRDAVVAMFTSPCLRRRGNEMACSMELNRFGSSSVTASSIRVVHLRDSTKI